MIKDMGGRSLNYKIKVNLSISKYQNKLIKYLNNQNKHK